MKPIRSERSKRVILVITMFFAVVLGAGGYLFFMLTRDPGIVWEPPNAVESNEALKNIAFYKKSKAEGVRGWVRISEIELNSYLRSILTNDLSTIEIPPTRFPVKLKQVGVSLSKTNITISSWADAKLAMFTVPFVVQRTVVIHQEGTNQWDFPMQSVRVGEVEIPRRFWRRLGPTVRALDAPVMAGMAWTTNIEAMLVVQNPFSQRSELRLYTYKPIPEVDRR